MAEGDNNWDHGAGTGRPSSMYTPGSAGWQGAQWRESQAAASSRSSGSSGSGSSSSGSGGGGVIGLVVVGILGYGIWHFVSVNENPATAPTSAPAGVVQPNAQPRPAPANNQTTFAPPAVIQPNTQARPLPSPAPNQSTSALPPFVMVTTTNLNLRSCASAQCGSVFVMPQGLVAKVIGPGENNWPQLEVVHTSGTYRGYASGQFLTPMTVSQALDEMTKVPTADPCITITRKDTASASINMQVNIIGMTRDNPASFLVRPQGGPRMSETFFVPQDAIMVPTACHPKRI